MRAPGMYPGVPEDDYHADPATSQTQLKELLACPARYRWVIDNPQPSTAAMAFGTLVHALALDTPHPYTVWEHDGRTKAGKAERADAAAAGLHGIDAATMTRARDAARAITTHPGARKMLDRVPADRRADYTELSVWWDDDVTGIRCRARIDRLTDLAPVDLKTTRDASPAAFARACLAYGYAEQAAHYGNGLRALGADAAPMVLIAVESEPPHLVALYTLTGDFLDYGAARIRHALDTLAECRAADRWPGYADELTPLAHPFKRET